MQNTFITNFLLETKYEIHGIKIKHTGMENKTKIPGSPSLHVDMLSHEQHLELFSISCSMEEVSHIERIYGPLHFH